MTFEDAMVEKAIREWAHESAANDLKAVSGDVRGPMGLTPDSIKQSPEWQHAFKIERNAFAAMRKFNLWVTKTYKKELKDLRDKQRNDKLNTNQMKGN